MVALTHLRLPVCLAVAATLACGTQPRKVQLLKMMEGWRKNGRWCWVKKVQVKLIPWEMSVKLRRDLILTADVTYRYHIIIMMSFIVMTDGILKWCALSSCHKWQLILIICLICIDLNQVLNLCVKQSWWRWTRIDKLTTKLRPCEVCSHMVLWRLFSNYTSCTYCVLGI